MRKLWKISIFMLLISFCACGFLSWNKNEPTVYASATEQACYYLLSESGVPYEANTEVGKVSGPGQFVVGKQNVVLTATANDNYQLVGWHVTYEEQSDKTEYFNVVGLTSDTTIELTADDDTKINASLTFTITEGYCKSGTFTLSRVFEDLTITPVFDHIYYKVDITDIINNGITQHTNSTAMGSNILYYETETEESGVTTYSNSYIKIGANYYYYGEIKSDGTKFYTVHNTLKTITTEEKIDYTRGAFRFGDNVRINFNVNIDADDVENSKNIDLVNVLVDGDRLSLYDGTKTPEQNPENNYCVNTQDSIKRTISYVVDFQIHSNEGYVNVIGLNYHKLYVVDVNLLVDGNAEHDEQEDILGNVTKTATDFNSNVSANNIHSIIDENALQFFVKDQTSNGGRSFGLTALQTISKTIDSITYRYYELNTFDGNSNITDTYYSGIDHNIVVAIDYTSIKYAINFDLAEYDSATGTLLEMSGVVPATIEVNRGASRTLTASDVLSNVGYKFVGFASSMTDTTLEKEITCEVDEEKPVEKIFIACFERIEYAIVLNNYNQYEVDGIKPINSLTFTKTNDYERLIETINLTALSGTSHTLTNKIKLGDSIVISNEINNGFNVLGYSLKNPATNDDYFVDSSFSFDADFIAELLYDNMYAEYSYIDENDWLQNWSILYVFDDENLEYVLNTNQTYNPDETYYVPQVVIYVHEEIVQNTITYIIEVQDADDTDPANDYVMADIDVVALGKTVVKYDLQGVEIKEVNGNIDAKVSKIEIIGLQLNDVITLKSVGLIYEGTANYVFNWFTEDDKTTMSYTQDGNSYNHTETVLGSKIIKVVYSIPIANIKFSIDSAICDPINNPDLTDLYNEFMTSFEVTGTNIEVKANVGEYSIEAGEVITITMADEPFGYNFIGYTLNGGSLVTVYSSSFNFTALAGGNVVVLKYERIKYQFYFSQYIDSLNKGYVDFDGENYIELTVDERLAEISKVDGYFVSVVSFGSGVAVENLKESNEIRNDANKNIYNFELNREQFINLVSAYGRGNIVDVRLDYTLFTYIVSVEYGLINPKGDDSDNKIPHQYISLSYSFGGENITINYPYPENKVEFVDIPHGSTNVIINVLGETPSGLKIPDDGKCWRFANGLYINSALYKEEEMAITITELSKDESFIYKYEYVIYSISVSANHGNSPEIKINGGIVENSSASARLFDKIEILANTPENNGYKYVSINKLIEYSYDSTTWEQDKHNLFSYNGRKFVQVYPETYNGSQYYTFVKINQETEENYIDVEFNANNYFVFNNAIYFDIKYEMKKFTIQNEISYKDDVTINYGSAEYTIEFEDVVFFTTRVNGGESPIAQGSPVFYNDIVTILIEINTDSLNDFDGKKYDLSKGLVLFDVDINGESINFTNIDPLTGKYSIEFYMAEYSDSEIVEIDFTLEVKNKEIKVTTIVDAGYENFYKHLTMQAYFFDLETPIGSSMIGVTTKLEKDLKFLMPCKVSANLKDIGSDGFTNNFKIVGYKVKCDGRELNKDEYDNYGVQIIDPFNIVQVSLCYDFEIIFKIQVIVTYNGGPEFSKDFTCDNTGKATSQGLSVGDLNSGCEIKIPAITGLSATLKYVLIGGDGTELEGATHCGIYRVLMSFGSTGDVTWIEDLVFEDNITLEITPKDIYLTYNKNIGTCEKVYDKSSNIEVSQFDDYLIITDKKGLAINYSNILSLGNGNFQLNGGSAYITSNGKDGKIDKADESKFYNIYFYDFALKSNSFNRNFNLVTSDLIIENYIKIKKKALRFGNEFYVYSKVYDGTNYAQLGEVDVELANKYANDDVYVNIDKLVVKFQDPSIGVNKTVIVNTESCLEGADASNYTISNVTVEGLTIYPYSISTTVEGYGEITLYNDRGLTEKDKVALIPLNSKLVVQPVYPESVEYANIYNKISGYLRGNNEFVVAYHLSIVVDGEKKEIDNNLYLSIPYISNSTAVCFISGEDSGKLNYSKLGEKFVIDLSQLDFEINSVFITKKRVLLNVWQIVLIVVTAVLTITAIVLTFVIIRKRKRKEYDVHEKI